MPRNTTEPLPGPVFREPVFAESKPIPPPSQFADTPDDDKIYNTLGDLQKKDVVAFDPSRGNPSDLYSLATAWGPHGADEIKRITSQKQIVFHAIGDSGASADNKRPDELAVTDAVTRDYHTSQGADVPSFLYHLGDLVYNFGESAYYYDQFYDPFQNYPAPIFAIPGNHDSFVVPNTPKGQEPLTTFRRNFCAEKSVLTQEARSLHRTAMTQPGVYFTLDAPYVRIIGLFSNALEDPGVISSQGGHWSAVPDVQLAFLEAQLKRVTSDPFKGAVLLAVHHPPFSYAPAAGKPGAGGRHLGNSVMLGEIDKICLATGIYPDAVLSAHAHNYQRYTRTLTFGGKTRKVPFIVCGNGGHNVNPVVSPQKGKKEVEPGDNVDVSYLDANQVLMTGGSKTKLSLNAHDQHNYGYLRIVVNSSDLIIEYHPVNSQRKGPLTVDKVTVDLLKHSA